MISPDWKKPGYFERWIYLSNFLFWRFAQIMCAIHGILWPSERQMDEMLCQAHHRGPDGERITTDQIEETFYSRKGITEQQKLSEIQTKALIEEKGGIENLEKDPRFSELPGLQEGEDRNQTSANVQAQTDFEAAGQLTTAQGQSTIKSTQTRTKYGNYYYPYDIKSNKQDRIIFKMKQSTGQIINPTADIQAGQKAVGTRTSKRKAKIIE